MATPESWDAREKIISSFNYLTQALNRYRDMFERLDRIKVSILDDPAKKDDLKLLFDQDTTLSLADVAIEYQKFKTIYDWLKTQ